MYIKVNGIELFYEKTGQGNPIILLHGNGQSHAIFDVLTKQLSQNYTVYAIDSRDHGKSSKVESLDYKDMMEDVAAFIHELNIEKPILYGFSDGGNIGLLLAIHYPYMLSRLIISGANIHPSGIRPISVFVLRLVYFFTRSRKFKLMLTQPNISITELNSIVAPTLVLAGEKNEFPKYEHTQLIADNIPNSELKILKGESHGSYIINSEKLYGIIKPFIGEIVQQ
ncbi:MAG: alpha/beta hydrolase [Oscillospiraceae bacterium]|nr:alpha/beta hydrolase [Oscillospiraceae bacterium]